MDPDPLSCIVNLVAAITQATTSQAAITFQAPTMSSWIALATAFLGLFFSAFNSGSKIAYFSLTSKDLEGIEDDAKRSRIQHLLDQPERLLASILIGNNLVNIMIVIVLNFAMNQMFTFNSSIANFLIQTVILTFLILLFGEVIPKLYATNNNVSSAGGNGYLQPHLKAHGQEHGICEKSCGPQGRRNFDRRPH